MTAKELCFALCCAGGSSGDESAVCEKAGEYLSEFSDVHTDRLGNLTFSFGTGKTHILLDAHLDSVGLIVRGIDDGGFLLVEKVGGVDERILTGARVEVFGKKKLIGVICSVPPHLLSEEAEKAGVSVKNLAVDIGLKKEEAEKLVEIGDRILVTGEQSSLLGSRIAASALDNRAGAAAVILAAKQVFGKIKNVKVTVSLSSQEEVGGSGAKTAAFSAEADFAVVTDVGFGSDETANGTETIKLGGGPSIGISPVLDRELTNTLKAAARENSIPYQHDVMGGRTGTNADVISNAGCGVKTALLSIPLRNMHTPVEVVDVLDVENTAKLIAAFILKKDGEASA